jgi:hypothetical protein
MPAVHTSSIGLPTDDIAVTSVSKRCSCIRVSPFLLFPAVDGMCRGGSPVNRPSKGDGDDAGMGGRQESLSRNAADDASAAHGQNMWSNARAALLKGFPVHRPGGALSQKHPPSHTADAANAGQVDRRSEDSTCSSGQAGKDGRGPEQGSCQTRGKAGTDEGGWTACEWQRPQASCSRSNTLGSRSVGGWMNG